jgi:hypothetical protein
MLQSSSTYEHICGYVRMQIVCKCAELGTYEKMDIWYSVSSKADYVGVPLRFLRGDGEKSKHAYIAA